MPTVIFVKKARKDNKQAGIKKGESYWYWSHQSGGRFVKTYFKTKPTRSQTTSSEFYSEAYGFEDALGALIDSLRSEKAEENYSAPDDLAGDVDSLASDVRSLGEAQTEKRDNMPEGLQESETGSLLEERADNCETLAGDLESASQDISNIDMDAEDAADNWREEAASILENVSWDL